MLCHKCSWHVTAAGVAVTLLLHHSMTLGEEVTIGQRRLTIPDGFEIQLVAGRDLVERPIATAFDHDGNLYVTDSAGMSDRADKQLELSPHRVRKLTDDDGDGVYDRSVVFADRMMFPEGCMWYDGSLYVAAPPQIWKLTDDDGDGRCDRREVWFDGQTLTGCGNDLHGPYLGPDGWFYWCKGAFAEQVHDVHGNEFRTRSSHIFRALPDGSRMEPVLTGGMDNPVNVAFLPNGERFLSCTFLQHPGGGNRDGLIHSVDGGVYGKRHDSIYEHPMTGDVMPPMTHMGAAAPCGLLAVDQGEFLFGQRLATRSLFGCYFNLHKVVQHELISHGSTYRTRERDLVACDHPDFHPTDVQNCGDGSLLIVDTGGWYKICCPTSQLAKPDVFGGIYRMRRAGQRLPVDDPFGKTLMWDELRPAELIDLLGDARPRVRERAKLMLRKLGAEAIQSLRDGMKHREPRIRSRVIWVLAGIDLPEARALIRDASGGVSTERNAALYAISLWRDKDGAPWALKHVADHDMRTARMAASALGRIGDRRGTAAILKALGERNFIESEHDASGSPIDSAVRVREHAFIHALIQLGDHRATRTGLLSSDPRVIRGALVALDQMPGSELDARDMFALLKHPSAIVSRTAAWVVGHHPQWGQSLVTYYAQQLEGDVSNRSQSLASQLSRLAKSPAIGELLARRLLEAKSPERRIVMQAMTESGLQTLPSSWLDAIKAVLPMLPPENAAEAIEQVLQWPLPKNGHTQLTEAMLAIARNEQVPSRSRLDALRIASPLTQLPDALYRWLVDCLSSEAEQGLRLGAAQVLGATQLSIQQQAGLLKPIQQAGPFELAALMPTLASGDEAFGKEVLSSLQQAPGFGGLRVDQLQSMLARFPDVVQLAAAPMLKQLNASIEEQTEHLERLLASLPAGDARRGHEIFNSNKTQCIACHTRAYHGGRLGPDLTNIGKVRNQRDLLEAIVFPSASLVRGYEPVSVLLLDGRIYSGIIRSESQEEIVLALDQEKLRHISRDDIDEIKPSSVSVMPNGIDKILDAQGLADLITFLRQ